MRKKLALEIFISAVIIFDIWGWNANHLPVWQFFPMWAEAIVEIEVGARLVSWLSRTFHAHRPFRLGQAR